MKLLIPFIIFLLPYLANCQSDSTQQNFFHTDSALRITDLNPYFTLHVDSILSYQLQINRDPSQYFWFIKNSPPGFRLNKESGLMSFRADRSYFMSGKLKYDLPYKVVLGVQNLNDPKDKIDTSITIVFFNTEIIPSKVKPTVNSNIWIEEGETASFRVFCEPGSFPIENIITLSSLPLANLQLVRECGDEFRWTPPYDLVRESDSGKVRIVQLSFIGTTKFQVKDTATVRIIVKEALNYPLANQDFQQVSKNISRYVLQLKYTFLQLDKKLRRTKNTRTSFDLTSASTSLTGTILATSSSAEAQKTGKILPSVGLALVPIKEASVPNKAVDQNQAASIRTTIKRLEYMLQDNELLGEKDPEVIRKTNKLKDELKQAQMQLIEVPIELTTEFSEEELNRYFNSPKVNKKYRLKG
jgi:hypothetical protein